jgi:hypothetical protein
LAGVAERQADHFEVGEQVGVADRDAFGIRRRARCVLQKGDILRTGLRQIRRAGRDRRRFEIHRQPLKALARKSRLQILADREG